MTPILQPSNVASPPKPIVPMPSLLAVSMMYSSSLPSSGMRFRTSSTARNSCWLRQLVARRAVAADADADEACGAALALALGKRRAGCICGCRRGRGQRCPEPSNSIRQAVLNIFVLAAAAFEDQLHFDIVVFPLLEVNDRNPSPRLSPVFAPVSESTEFGRKLPICRFDKRFFNRCLDFQLIDSDWRFDFECRQSGILANW